VSVPEDAGLGNWERPVLPGSRLPGSTGLCGLSRCRRGVLRRPLRRLRDPAWAFHSANSIRGMEKFWSVGLRDRKTYSKVG
jgi:hypothetical protein